MGTRQNANKISNAEVKTKRSLSEKMLSQKQKKKNNGENQSANNRLLITVNVLGSAGPIKFVVNEDDIVTVVIDTALKLYARERRLPVLGSDGNNFLLYPANAGLDGTETNSSLNLVFMSSESIRIDSRGKELRPLQETEAATDDGSKVGDGCSEKEQ
ncbi:unnamed protein product [Ilex paraguariensis]|uniref:DUF7054 domain-containing protein n=2 Tax=Ilex paraguariensis TaxID=185542 RepID=A0ABC8TAS2_9AQUA